MYRFILFFSWCDIVDAAGWSTVLYTFVETVINAPGFHGNSDNVFGEQSNSLFSQQKQENVICCIMDNHLVNGRWSSKNKLMYNYKLAICISCIISNNGVTKEDI